MSNCKNERRSLKEKLLNTKSPRLQESAKEARGVIRASLWRVWLGKLNRLQREEIWVLSTRSQNSSVESGTTTLPQLRTKVAIPYQLSESALGAAPIIINGQHVESVDDFTYLGSLITLTTGLKSI